MKKLPFIWISLGLIGGACSTEASYKVTTQLTSPYITDEDNKRNDDDQLREQLQDKLTTQLAKSQLRVIVDHGNVLLVGQVVTTNDRSQASAICYTIPVVKKIFNYLTVAAKPSLNLNSSLANKAKNRITVQDDIYSPNLQVIAVAGVIYLMGSNIGNLTALQAAIEGIYTYPGVTRVINLVQPGPDDYTTDVVTAED